MSCFEEIPGGAELLRWFGETPSFHDAEILSVHLDRSAPSSVRIHAWRMTQEIKDAHYVLDKHAVVTFVLDEVIDLDLSEFNLQNVIFGLSLNQIADGFELVLDHCWGLSGRIVARRVRIEIEPGKPQPS